MGFETSINVVSHMVNHPVEEANNDDILKYQLCSS